MDEFRTGAETACRERAADYFRRLPRPAAAGAPVPAEEIWRALDEPSGDAPRPLRPGHRLGERVLILEEAARHDPRLGPGLTAGPAADAPPGPVERTALQLAGLAGMADHVLEAGSKAARDSGYYASSLMSFREIQERLAGLVTGAELARLGACRLCRLLDKGERDRAVREAEGLAARFAPLAAEVRSLAGSLLGPEWVEARLPAAEPPAGDERTSP